MKILSYYFGFLKSGSPKDLHELDGFFIHITKARPIPSFWIMYLLIFLRVIANKIVWDCWRRWRGFRFSKLFLDFLLCWPLQLRGEQLSAVSVSSDNTM